MEPVPPILIEGRAVDLLELSHRQLIGIRAGDGDDTFYETVFLTPTFERFEPDDIAACNSLVQLTRRLLAFGAEDLDASHPYVEELIAVHRDKPFPSMPQVESPDITECPAYAPEATERDPTSPVRRSVAKPTESGDPGPLSAPLARTEESSRRSADRAASRRSRPWQAVLDGLMELNRIEGEVSRLLLEMRATRDEILEAILHLQFEPGSFRPAGRTGQPVDRVRPPTGETAVTGSASVSRRVMRGARQLPTVSID